jgi:hypothetical protein
MALEITPLPDYLRGGEFIPMQVAGDRDTFRPTPLAPVERPKPKPLMVAALALVGLAIARAVGRR